MNYAKDKAKEKVLRTQGRVLQAQEKVADKVSQTLDKVPLGLGETLKKNMLGSPSHSTDDVALTGEDKAAEGPRWVAFEFFPKSTMPFQFHLSQ